MGRRSGTAGDDERSTERRQGWWAAWAWDGVLDAKSLREFAREKEREGGTEAEASAEACASCESNGIRTRRRRGGAKRRRSARGRVKVRASRGGCGRRHRRGAVPSVLEH